VLAGLEEMSVFVHSDAVNATSETGLARPGVSCIEGNTFRLARSRVQYLEDIAACMDALQCGESYEICLTNSMSAGVPSFDAWQFFQVLRHVNAAPHSAWLHCGEVRHSLPSAIAGK
jgi:anthranilate/para-aminobenzoate synthase component I